jgi:peptidylprolyl isomerase
MTRTKRAAWATLVLVCLAPAACSRDNKAEVPLQDAPSKSGLKYADLVVGGGPEAKVGDTVSIQYVGWLQSGIKFDSSYDRSPPKPLEFKVGSGEMIKGMEEGISGMKVGGKRRLVLPPELAYGERGQPPRIPPFAELTFEVELVGVK